MQLLDLLGRCQVHPAAPNCMGTQEQLAGYGTFTERQKVERFAWHIASSTPQSLTGQSRLGLRPGSGVVACL